MVEFPSKLPETPEEKGTQEEKETQTKPKVPVVISLENGKARVEFPGGRIYLEGKNIKMVLGEILPSSGKLDVEVSGETVEDLKRKKEATGKTVEMISEKLSRKTLGERSISVREFFELSDLFQELKRLEEAAYNSSLDEESKKRIGELVEKILSTSSSEVIQITPQDLEKVKSIFNVLEEIYGLFREIHKIPQKLLDHYKKSDEERFFTSAYFLKIVKTIVAGQFDQTLSLLISGISNALTKRDLRIDTAVFSAYIKPMIAMIAGAMVSKIQSSKQIRDNIRREFESAGVKFENI